MNYEELDKILTVCKAHGVVRLRTKELAIELVPVEPIEGPILTRRNALIGDEEKAPTEDQLLFWSTGLAPEHEAEPPP